MAFAQQQRRPAYKNLNTSSSEEYSDYGYEAVLQNHRSQATSDSDMDWHVISSALPSSTHTSPILIPSETESTRIVSDTESYSDFDSNAQGSMAYLPSHDGTGTFLIEDSSDQNTTSEASNAPSEFDDDEEEEGEDDEFRKVIHRLLLDYSEDEEMQEKSLLDITLPHGGIKPPSFVPISDNDEPPCFIPTAAGLNSQELTNGVPSGEMVDNTLLSDEGSSTKRYHDDNIKFTSKRQTNLDRIPIHHPGIPGSSTSAALLSLVWNSLRRLTNHLLENDTNTVETLGALMSEAMFEGCIPFGSHLHMEIDNGFGASSSYFEGNIAI